MNNEFKGSAIETYAFLILPTLLIVNIVGAVRDQRQYALFKSLELTTLRQRFLRKWLVESFLFHGLTALFALAVLGELSAVVQFPAFLMELSEPIQEFASGQRAGMLGSLIHGMALVIVPALLIGPTLISLLMTYSQFKNRTDIQPPTLESRDLECLLPRNPRERIWTTLLAINAGISEELYFRLLAPTLFFLVTGNALFSIVAATIWFGLAHFYQGWVGICVTMFLGAILMFTYLFTQSLGLVIVIHAVLDLNGLCFVPWYKEWLAYHDKPAP